MNPNRVRNLVATTAFTALVCLTSGKVAAEESPVLTYLSAISTMQALPQPPFMTYRANVKSSGMRFVVRPFQEKYAEFAVVFGRANPDVSWTGVHRTSDNRSMLLLDHQPPLIARSPLLNPTWQGAYNWLKQGLFDEQDDAATATPRPAPSPTIPDASASPVATIGMVSVVNSKDYVITRVGPEACAFDGSAGDHLHLQARLDEESHPLTDVVVAANGRICTMRFSLGARSAMSFRGAFQLDFGPVGNWWLIQHGTANFAIRAFGISTSHSNVSFDYQDFAFPNQLPDSEFVVDSSSMGRP